MADPSRAADEDFPVPLRQPAGSSLVAASTIAGDASAATSSSSSQTQTQARGQARAPKAPRPCKFYTTKTGKLNPLSDFPDFISPRSYLRGQFYACSSFKLIVGYWMASTLCPMLQSGTRFHFPGLLIDQNPGK